MQIGVKVVSDIIEKYGGQIEIGVKGVYWIMNGVGLVTGNTWLAGSTWLRKKDINKNTRSSVRKEMVWNRPLICHIIFLHL